ncbi:fimbria/pilus periplasmic chaperone [Enterobacter cloacae complex sp. ECC445]|uniref:fimbria/pilus chaperone family protein n=1 Tax=Enterobacter cloacae complex sp. ECC445 TaxID=2913213 RepID=UPI001EECF77E|nr:fimbria/pilus chaperone family protein [Enterobacter cloacae complex sp. ECC445]MCG0456387.1 fimbria/pilus periplasmic chaperone [Enterobacter cloacae complex sp. ECC445]
MERIVKASALVTALFLTLPATVYAAGMVPETTLLMIDEANRGGVMSVKNTDSIPTLLYTSINDIEGENGVKLNVTQPVVRLEPGQEQQVRFILETKEPLTVEHYKRVIFEGIPPKTKDKNVKVGINLRQDLPVLIHPKNLPVVTDAWKLLTWSVQGKEVQVRNTSAYVVRFSTSVTLLPSRTEGLVNKTFILPGETMKVQTRSPIGSTDNAVEFSPASRYGIEVDKYTAALTR